MLIHLQNTYNPNAMKFIIEHVWLDFIWECKDSFDANKSLLARNLWNIDGVVYLLFGSEFVLVTKKEEFNWDELSCVVMEVIKDYLETHTKLFEDSLTHEIIQNQKTKKTLSNLDEQIIKILDEKVQPALKLHGGLVEFIGFDNGILKLNLQGACKNCASSEVTLKMGIKNLLQYYFPEIQEVQSV